MDSSDPIDRFRLIFYEICDVPNFQKAIQGLIATAAAAKNAQAVHSLASLLPVRPSKPYIVFLRQLYLKNSTYFTTGAVLLLRKASSKAASELSNDKLIAVYTAVATALLEFVTSIALENKNEETQKAMHKMDTDPYLLSRLVTVLLGDEFSPWLNQNLRDALKARAEGLSSFTDPSSPSPPTTRAPFAGAIGWIESDDGSPSDAARLRLARLLGTYISEQGFPVPCNRTVGGTVVDRRKTRMKLEEKQWHRLLDENNELMDCLLWAALCETAGNKVAPGDPSAWDNYWHEDLNLDMSVCARLLWPTIEAAAARRGVEVAQLLRSVLHRLRAVIAASKKRAKESSTERPGSDSPGASPLPSTYQIKTPGVSAGSPRPAPPATPESSLEARGLGSSRLGGAPL